MRYCGELIDPLQLIDFNNQPKLDKLKAVEQFLIRFKNLMMVK